MPLALALYGLIYLGIPTALFSFKSESLLARTLARITTVVAFILELVIMMRLHSRLRQVRAEANAQGAEGFASWWPASTGHSGPTGTPPSWR